MSAEHPSLDMSHLSQVLSEMPHLPGLPAHYQLNRELGRGGMGVVYLGQDTRLERPVAIKVLTLNSANGSEHQQESILRFQREAKVIARLNHPHIVSIFDVQEAGQQYYMMMEYADGKTLAALAGSERLTPQWVARIGFQVCQALAYAHEHQIIHRDIKPGNIILTRRGEAKLMDFGIAQLQVEGARLTQAGAVMGSLAYASPEQIQDVSSVDHRSDLYSLGVTLYELITGQLPYQATQLSGLILEVLSKQPLPSVRDLRPEMPEVLAHILTRALSKDREERYASALEMAKDLAILAGEQAHSGNTAFTLDFTQTDSGKTSLRRGTQLKRTRLDPQLIQTLERNRHWVLTWTENWKKDQLPALKLKQVFAKLGESVLFGESFSGLLVIDQTFVCFISEGLFTGIVHLSSGEFGSELFARLPESPQSLVLRQAPEGQAQIPLLLANLTARQGDVLQSQLDASLIEAESLLASLNEPERPFSGYIVCHAAENIYYFGYISGEQRFVASALPDTALQATSSLAAFLTEKGCVISIYRCQPALVGPSVQNLLRQAHLEVSYHNPAGTRLQTLVDQGDDELPPHLLKEVKENVHVSLHWEGNPQFQLAGKTHDATDFISGSLNDHLARWLVLDYFFRINASGNTTALKYIYSWIAATQSLWFEQELMGADGQPRCFSLVSHGEIPGEGRSKVLHLCRIGSGQEKDVLRFLEDALSVKKHLMKSGDIGGALYLSTEEYTSEALKLFYARTVEPRKGLGLGALDKLTKYKGFVRMGMGRGFHLNLLHYQDKRIEVVAPLLK